MRDINEEIVKTYFQLKGYLAHPNLKYMVHHETGSGESDIDLAISNPKTGDKAIVEVKGWHNDYFTKSYFEEGEDPEGGPNTIFNFVKETEQNISENIIYKSRIGDVRERLNDRHILH